MFSVTDNDDITGEFIVDREREELFPVGEWTHIGVTYNTDLQMTSFYQNGIKIAETSTARDADKVGPIGQSAGVKGIGWNGPFYEEESLNGVLDEFQLFAGTITPEQVRSLIADAGDAVPDQDVIEADMEAITLEETLYDGTAPLPILGPNGSQISWESSHPDVVKINDETFTVTQPSSTEGDQKVTLTATFKVGEASDIKEFQATVPAGISAAEDELPDSPSLSDVTLEDPFLSAAQAAGANYLLNLEPQKFLYNFYEVAGVNQPEENSPYAESWEDPEGWNFRGHMFGHYMSSLALQHSYATDAEKPEYKERIDEVLTGLEAASSAWDEKYPDAKGYISAFPEAFLAQDGNGGTVDGLPANDERAAGDVLIVPYYNLHKVLAGLVEIARIMPEDEAGERALELANGFGHYLANRLVGNVNKEQLLATEYGGMNEALYDLYALTKDERIKETAELFDETVLFEQLANGENPLPGKHANTQIPKLTGALKRYHVLTQDDELFDRLTSEERA